MGASGSVIATVRGTFFGTDHNLKASRDFSRRRSSVKLLAVRQLSQRIVESVVNVDGIDSNYETEENRISVIPPSKPDKLTSPNKKRPQLSIMVKDFSFNGNANIVNSMEEEIHSHSTPPHKIHLSTRTGSLSIGNFDINEKGLKLADKQTPYGFLSEGISDFIMVGKLGSGITCTCYILRFA